METTDEQRPSRSGISNFYYGGVTNVINLKLSKELVEVLGPGNNIAETINSFINQNTKKNDDDR
jgi:ERCC4-type nuclease